MMRGTDPHIFLVRALQSDGLTEKDIAPVLLQHPDGKTALIRGDVDAWAGLDPMMAQAEVEDGAQLFYRNKAANTWGILNVREEFRKQHPDVVQPRARGLRGGAQICARATTTKLKQSFIRPSPSCRTPVVEKQLKERTELTHNRVGPAAARVRSCRPVIALQKAGVIKARVST